jgi:hypothetical protein
MLFASEKTSTSPRALATAALSAGIFPCRGSASRRTPRDANARTIALVSSVEPSEATMISSRSGG